MDLVTGKNLVPSPAAGITAFVISTINTSLSFHIFVVFKKIIPIFQKKFSFIFSPAFSPETNGIIPLF